MKLFKGILILLAALLLCGAALAEDAQPAPEASTEARDITMDCALNGYWGSESPGKMRDNDYQTFWESVRRSGAHSLTITAPEDETIGGVLIRWRSWQQPALVQVENADGKWETVASCEADFNAQYIAIPNLTEFRIIHADGGKTQLKISEITIITPGEVPSYIQVWRKPPEKVDLMMVEAHPDDEVLWFGGLLPYYAGEREMEVLVVNAVFNNYYRRLELLDSLWTCGIKNYPVILNYLDINNTPREILKKWNKQTVMEDIVTAYRQYKPDVVVLHDEDGEYGHGAHIVMSDLGRQAVEAANDPTKYKDSYKAYGTWDVPKTYLHLWAENQIQMDWHVPLNAFDGLTGMEVATLAFECHKSQLVSGDWAMETGGEYDNSLFGLWRSTVGEDVLKNDLFENIPSAE